MLLVAAIILLIPIIVYASKSKQTQTDPKIIENIQKEITYKPADTVVKTPFPTGNDTPTIKAQPAQRVWVEDTEQTALEWIISHEGGPTSVNTSSLACGLAQSLPCSKILTYAGVDLSLYNLETYAGVKAAISTVPVETQRSWMIQYCIRRYGSIVNAKSFWLQNGWY